MLSSTSASENASEKDQVISIHAGNAPHQRHFTKGEDAGIAIANETDAETASELSLQVDKNRPETFLNSDDLERVTNSEIYPQKRLFSALHTRKMPQIPDQDERKVYPLYHTNPIYFVFFWWVYPILRVGYKRTLQPNDLWVMDDKISIETLYKRFSQYLERDWEIARQEYAKLASSRGNSHRSAQQRCAYQTRTAQGTFAYLQMAVFFCISSYGLVQRDFSIYSHAHKALN